MLQEQHLACSTVRCGSAVGLPSGGWGEGFLLMVLSRVERRQPEESFQHLRPSTQAHTYTHTRACIQRMMLAWMSLDSSWTGPATMGMAAKTPAPARRLCMRLYGEWGWE